MPKEMIVALNIIFALLCLRIVRQIWLLRKENKSKGGRPMKHNGRFRV
jgi:TRAP-type C4-dicarboxylate transport system permease small subunit